MTEYTFKKAQSINCEMIEARRLLEKMADCGEFIDRYIYIKLYSFTVQMEDDLVRELVPIIREHFERKLIRLKSQLKDL